MPSPKLPPGLPDPFQPGPNQPHFPKDWPDLSGSWFELPGLLPGLDLPPVKDGVLPGHSDCRAQKLAEWFEAPTNWRVALTLGEPVGERPDVSDRLAWAASAAVYTVALVADLAVVRREKRRGETAAHIRFLASRIEADNATLGGTFVPGLLSSEYTAWLDLIYQAGSTAAGFHLVEARPRTTEEAGAWWAAGPGTCDRRLPAMPALEYLRAVARWNDAAREPARVARTVAEAKRLGANAEILQQWSADRVRELDGAWRDRVSQARQAVLDPVPGHLRARAVALRVRVAALAEELAATVTEREHRREALARARAELFTLEARGIELRDAIARAVAEEAGIEARAVAAEALADELTRLSDARRDEIVALEAKLRDLLEELAEDAEAGKVPESTFRRLDQLQDSILQLADAVIHVAAERAAAMAEQLRQRLALLPVRGRRLTFEVDLAAVTTRSLEARDVVARLDREVERLNMRATVLQDGLADVARILGEPPMLVGE